MNPAMKCMKLDFMLLKPYAKSVLLVLLVPLMFPFLRDPAGRVVLRRYGDGHDDSVHLLHI